MTYIRPDVLEAIRRCRLWRRASDEVVQRLAESATVRDEPRGALLAAQGEAAERLGIVVVGKARVYHAAADGRTMAFETVSAGESLLPAAALSGSRYPANVEASTPVTIAWIHRKEAFALIAQEPDVARDVIVDLAHKVVELTSMVTGFASDVPSRLARFLFNRSLEVGTATPAGLSVDIGMTKAELASALGTVPETLSRAFARLRDDSVLEVRGRTVLVKDVGALARLGSGYEES